MKKLVIVILISSLSLLYSGCDFIEELAGPLCENTQVIFTNNTAEVIEIYIDGSFRSILNPGGEYIYYGIEDSYITYTIYYARNGQQASVSSILLDDCITTVALNN